MRPFRVALFHDDALRAQANAAGKNYWPVYYREILSRLGVSHVFVDRDMLALEKLSEYAVLLLPPLPEGYLAPGQADALARWVEGSGLLVGFATRGLEGLFGVEIEGGLSQVEDEYSPSSCLRFTDPEWTSSLLPPDDRGLRMPVLAPALRLAAPACRELARLHSLCERDLQCPAVTYRVAGEGAACYWAFDLAQCVWAMHQGRPVEGDYDGDGVLKTVDGIAIRPWSGEVPYADLMLFALRRVLAEHGAAFLYPLPPTPEGAIPEALFHWGGDDCALSEVNLPAARFMREVGLPYHVNLQQRPACRNQLPSAEVGRLRELGCEVGIQFRLYPPEGQGLYAFTRDDLAAQLEAFVRDYGQMPVVTVFSRCEWTGWSEPARWLCELGLKGDNNRFARVAPPPNPYDVLAFAWGTGFPFHYYEDWRRQNRRIDVTSQPITAYEPGIDRDHDQLTLAVLHRALDLARFWNLTMNLFYHPVNIARREITRRAIHAALDYLKEQGTPVLHVGSDALCLWWHARSASAIEEQSVAGAARLRAAGVVMLRTRTEYPAGCVVQMLAPEGEVAVVRESGETASHAVREQHGARWLYVAMPAGEATVMIRGTETRAPDSEGS